MTSSRPHDRPVADPVLRVTLLTEGTYPYVVGGVSTWCQDLIAGLPDLAWDVIPITAGGFERVSAFDLPANASVHDGIDLWGSSSPAARPDGLRRRRFRRGGVQRSSGTAARFPAELADLVLSPDGDMEALAELFARCRHNPELVPTAFRSPEAWHRYIEVMRRLTGEASDDLFTPVSMTTLDAAKLWQTLFWLATTATINVPPSDVVLCTAAGWPAAIASWVKLERGTPVVVAEHGLYVREAYLESVRTNRSAGQHFASTKLASGLARLAYHLADRITPVSDRHHPWEERLGADPGRIQTVVNGVDLPDGVSGPTTTNTVVSIGRVDPLKDLATGLRAARLVCDTDDDAVFLHYGPVSPANERYNQMCLHLHRELGLGDRFRFMGGTSDPRGAMRDSALYLSTSISEGLPLSVMEAMSEARPVVATDVGGCADLVGGCGLLAPAGDANAVAAGIRYLLDRPDMAAVMGRRGRRRAERRFSKRAHLATYRQVLTDVAV